MAIESVEITVINSNTFTGWAAGLFRVGEVEMESVATMVKNVLDEVGKNLISRLNIIDHGSSKGADMGEDYLDVKSVENFAPLLSKLRKKFDGEGFVHMQHCELGNNKALLLRLAKIFGVPVYAGTGKHAPVLRTNMGNYVVAFPGGSFAGNQPRP